MTESFPHSGWAEAYYAPVYYHALKRCGNVWDAADVTQSTFVKALIHGGDLRNREALGPWLYRICDNELGQLYRRRHREPASCSLSEERFLALPAKGEEDPSARKLRQLTETLPEPFRLPLLLHYYAGFTLREIALVTGLPEVRVKSRLYDGRQKLRRLLQADGAPSTHGPSVGPEEQVMETTKERRKWLMDKLKRITEGARVLPSLSLRAQSLLRDASQDNGKFPPEVLAELAFIPGGGQWAADCDGTLSYDEFLEVLACCDEATICRLNGQRYHTWGYREPTALMQDLARVAGTGGYVQSVEPILVVPSLRETLNWYRKHLGWDGCDWEEMEDYGYTSIHAYTGGCDGNTGKEFKGFHLWKGTSPDHPGSFFCFVLEIEALRERILRSGWDQVTEVVDRGWGCKGFCCVDLNGYRLEFCEWLPENQS